MRIVRTRIESAIESARGCESVIEEKEFAIEIAKETGIAKGPVVVIETEDRGIIEAVAETSHIKIEAGTVIVTEIDTGKGNGSKKENFLVSKLLCLLHTF
jgi:hypothetical protein